jgi:hypothetical protein
VVYTAIEYYSLLKNEILAYITCKSLESIMPSEISQILKDKYCMIPLICDT